MRRALNLLAALQQKQPAPSQRIELKRPARDQSDYFASPAAAVMVAASLFQETSAGMSLWFDHRK